MRKRKLIGLLISYPEGVYQQRILDGVFSQCKKYDYDAAVFSPLVQTCHFDKKYLEGEIRIFDLVNYDKLDGVIVSPLSMISDNDYSLYESMIKKVSAECTKPVISIDLPFGDAPVKNTDDHSAFVTIAEHVINTHGCRKVYFLSGPKDHSVSEIRLEGCRDAFEKNNIPFPEENIFYGDFWYTGGEQLAERIISGELELPDAIICASDHMAIGAANKLMDNGINIPSQVIVTGFDATPEAVVNDPAITSYIPDICIAAAEAVNALREIIEPGKELLAPDDIPGEGLKICSSCGCPENITYMKNRLNSIMFNTPNSYFRSDRPLKIDIGRLLDSYMFENFTGSENVLDCFEKIFASDYLIAPYDAFYLCLKEHWLSTEESSEDGYPDVMNNCIHCVPSMNITEDNDPRHLTVSNDHLFETKELFPQLDNDRDHPSVFYFVPVHFSNITHGYAVLERSLECDTKLGIVFRNWLRNVNNALEMIRVQNSLTMFSHRDPMTGLLNRRGMDSKLKELTENASPSSSWLVFVIDMDGLKYINDHFGHSEGDKAISLIAQAARQVTRSSEICVRAGGDEFYIIGVGGYHPTDAIVKIQKFNQVLAEENKTSRPYELSASIGYCCEPLNSGIGFNGALNLADSRMYEDKLRRKKERK